MKFDVVVGIFVVIGLVQCNVPDVHSTSPFTRIEEEQSCTFPGVMCDGCHKVVACVKNGDRFEKIFLEACGDGQTCLHGICYNFINQNCEQELRFPCNAVGVFPDPYDCKAYHFCVQKDDGSLKNYKAKCDEGYAYDISAGFCKIKLVDGACLNEYPVPRCNFAGHSEALYPSRNIYFICAKYSEEHPILYPFLYTCPDGSEYTQFKCIFDVEKNTEKLMRRF